MKILPYKNLFIGITETLKSIFIDGKHADREVDKVLKSNPKWGSKDRAFIAETIYDCIRWKRWIEASMGKEVDPKSLWEFVGTWFVLCDEKLPHWEEFKRINPKEIIRKNHLATKDNFAVSASIPDWMYELGCIELGKEIWENEITAMNEMAATIIRVNTFKSNRKELQNRLKDEGVLSEPLPNYPHALKLMEKSNILRTQTFREGYFEIQDAASQRVAPFLNAKEGMRIVDACAGAGGKSLHLSNLMNNKGQIYALDIHEWKLLELKKRAKRNGAQNIQTKLVDSSKIIKRMENSVDRLLIDAPCSGLGVLRRNPDAKWKLTPEFIEEIKKEQEKILNEYSKMLKKGGAMVYATCSILPCENQKQIQKFTKNHPEFKLIKDQQLLPSETGYDGFYMAYLEKID